MRTTKHHRRRTYPGFSLIEILIVTAIIITLAMLSFSGGRRMIISSRIVASSANLRSLAIANATYLSDNGVYCPADDQSDNRKWHGTRKSGGRFDPTKGFLSPYLGKSQQVTQCPLFRAMVDGSASYESGAGGYGYNAAYIGGFPGGGFDRVTRIRIPQRAANVPNPGRTIMFTTVAYAQSEGLQEYSYCEPPFREDGGKYSPTVHFRAHGKALVAWCDGRITAETKNSSTPGHNPHGGDAEKWNLGWFGPLDNNGFWNPEN